MVGLEQRIACNFQGASLFLSDYFPLHRSCAFLPSIPSYPLFISPTPYTHTPPSPPHTHTHISYIFLCPDVLSCDPSGLDIAYLDTRSRCRYPRCNDSSVRVCKCTSTNVRARLRLIISRSVIAARALVCLHNGPSDDPGIPGTLSGAFSGEKNRHSSLSYHAMTRYSRYTSDRPR